MNVFITKASGKKEVFSKGKLLTSLIRSGASDALAATIVSQIEARLVEGSTTKEIYKKAHKILRNRARRAAGRYHLKRGIMELGPSGFPFEKYVSEILKHQGYRVQVGKTVPHSGVRCPGMERSSIRAGLSPTPASPAMQSCMEVALI